MAIRVGTIEAARREDGVWAPLCVGRYARYIPMRQGWEITDSNLAASFKKDSLRSLFALGMSK